MAIIKVEYAISFEALTFATNVFLLFKVINTFLLFYYILYIYFLI